MFRPWFSAFAARPCSAPGVGETPPLPLSKAATWGPREGLRAAHPLQLRCSPVPGSRRVTAASESGPHRALPRERGPHDWGGERPPAELLAPLALGLLGPSLLRIPSGLAPLSPAGPQLGQLLGGPQPEGHGSQEVCVGARRQLSGSPGVTRRFWGLRSADGRGQQTGEVWVPASARRAWPRASPMAE